jgi:hypothetical protein
MNEVKLENKMAEKKKWIQAIHMKKGALRKELHVPKGKKISEKKLKMAEKKGGVEGKRAHLAETLKKMHNKCSDCGKGMK